MTRRAPAAPAAANRKINLNASASKRSGTTPAAFTAGPPLKPRRKLFAGLLVAFVVWVAVLLTLYFTTIYPRHAPGDIRAAEAVGSEAS